MKEYDGGYDDYLRQRSSTPSKAAANPPSAKPEPVVQEKVRKLAHKEKKELEKLPKRIETLESEQGELHVAMADPNFYKQTPAVIAEANGRLDAIEAELKRSYKRWEELEDMP